MSSCFKSWRDQSTDFRIFTFFSAAQHQLSWTRRKMEKIAGVQGKGRFSHFYNSENDLCTSKALWIYGEVLWWTDAKFYLINSTVRGKQQTHQFKFYAFHTTALIFSPSNLQIGVWAPVISNWEGFRPLFPCSFGPGSMWTLRYAWNKEKLAGSLEKQFAL